MTGPLHDAITTILKELGEDPDREGLLDTPDRVEKSLRFLTKGYHESVESVINGAIFTEEASEIVLLRDIDLYSLCEHHLLPFFGKCHVAYIPAGRVIGLSKIPRLVEVFSRRLQVQERLTEQIAESLERYLRPEGVAVVIEAYHLCMSMRGIEKQETLTVTSAMKGAFLNDRSTRMEFLDLLKQSKRI